MTLTSYCSWCNYLLQSISSVMLDGSVGSAPSICSRQSVNETLSTGTLGIDVCIPEVEAKES
jgi:hypothetical protein